MGERDNEVPILFNSETRYNAFFAALPGFLGRMPEFRPSWIVKSNSLTQ
jgi:hypothetical protein